MEPVATRKSLSDMHIIIIIIIYILLNISVYMHINSVAYPCFLFIYLQSKKGRDRVSCNLPSMTAKFPRNRIAGHSRCLQRGENSLHDWFSFKLYVYIICWIVSVHLTLCVGSDGYCGDRIVSVNKDQILEATKSFGVYIFFVIYFIYNDCGTSM